LAVAFALADQSFEKRAIDGVLRTLRVFGADEGAGAGDLRHPAQVDVLGVLVKRPAPWAMTAKPPIRM